MASSGMKIFLLLVVTTTLCFKILTNVEAGHNICGQRLDTGNFLPHFLHRDHTGYKPSTTTNCTLIDDCALCDNLHYFDVPQNLPPIISYLIIRFNNLARLGDNVFSRYPGLQHLDVSYNKIGSLTNQSFNHLVNLTALNLRGNLLEMTSVMYPAAVFDPLKRLTTLQLQNKNGDLSKPGLTYPDKALSNLKNLATLSMDGLPVDLSGPFGEGFRNLTCLKYLSLSGHDDGNCKLIALNNDTFTNLQTLERLDMHDCSIRGKLISPGAFLPLTQLRRLDLSFNEDINIQHLSNVFQGLQNAKHMSFFHMQMIANRYSTGICLDASFIELIPQTLTYLDFRDNNLVAVDRQVMKKLPPSLETLNLNGNGFVFGGYLLDLPQMKNLKTLYLNGLRMPHTLPTSYPYEGNSIMTQQSSNCSIYVKEPTPFQLHLPPKLTQIFMQYAGLSYNISELNVNKNNTLRSLSMSSNRFPYLVGPVTGLHALEELDLSSCYVVWIDREFFQDLKSLQRLRLDANFLGDFFASRSSYHDNIFTHLKNLKALNLSFNDIRWLPQNLFLPLKSLQDLYLAKNPLMTFEVDISKLYHLHILDLSITHISTLPRDVMDHIKLLIQRRLQVRVNMTQNPITCDCQNLEFLQWMTSSKAFDKNFTNYRCQLGQVSTTIIDGYRETLADLSRHCAHNMILFFLVGAGTLCLFIMIMAAIIFRFRWNIRYMYYAAYLRYKKKSTNTEDGFQYDAFICYAEEDEDFAEQTLDRELSSRDVTVFLHRRDFKVGQFISSNIVHAVGACRKTVVVLTQALMDSHWCMYEIEMAKMEGLYSDRQVLLFILKERIPRGKLGRDLLYNIKNNTYQEFPVATDNEEQMRIWWDKLATDIKTV